MKRNFNIVAIVMVTMFLFNACATYYQKSYEFHQNFATGNLEAAQAFLNKQEKAAEKKDRLLYFLDRGVVEQMLGNYEASNAFFEQAYRYNESFKKSLINDLTVYVINPMAQPYRAEDFEIVLVHFYKAINYIQLNDMDAALVEVRRVNISLNSLNDKYENKKNRYKEDAFAHTLMGIIYEAKGEYNDAFIAYRNAYEAYHNTYSKEFQIDAPLQLKKDLLRTAYYNGFRNELERYEEEFGFNYEHGARKTGDLVFFWLNGLGPVKSEFSLNLSVAKGEGGFLTFANNQENITIPYSTSESYYSADPAEFKDLKFVRMAVPKYSVRKPLVSQAVLEVGGDRFTLEQVEDVNKIAVSTLQDRMLREISKSIGRLAVKQAAEAAARSKNEDIGTIVSLLNAVTEKADTRNWQTLPHSIYYQRLTLAPDTHNIKLITGGNNIRTDTLNFEVNITAGQTEFRTFHSLESTLPIEQ